MQQTEAQILKLAKSKNLREAQHGFTLLMQRHQQAVYYQIRRIVGNHHDTDDLLQEVFVKVWKNLNSFEGQAKLSSWIYKIAYNETMSFLRKKKIPLLAPTDHQPNPADLIEAPETLPPNLDQTLRDMVSQLPPGQQMVFNLKYYDNLPYKEIATITNLSEGALKAQYFYAVKKITEKINQSH